MKHQSWMLAAAASVLLAASLPAFADAKIAVVRFPDLMQNAPQAKLANQKATADFQKRADDIRAQEKQLQDDTQKFQRDAVTMQKDQAEKLEHDLSTRQNDMKFLEDQFQRDVEAKREEIRKSVFDTVSAAINLVAKEKGIDLVLPDYVYATPGFDITEEVMKHLAPGTVAPAAAGK